MFYRLWKIELSLEELQDLVDESDRVWLARDSTILRGDFGSHDGYAYQHHGLPLGHVQRYYREQLLKKWRVK